MTTETLWTVSTGQRTEFGVRASDQWEAFDVMRDVPTEHLGLLVEACKQDDPEDAFAVRTSRLMVRWGRFAVARLIIAAVVEAGGPDTTAEDFADVAEVDA